MLLRFKVVIESVKSWQMVIGQPLFIYFILFHIIIDIIVTDVNVTKFRCYRPILICNVL